MHYKKAIGTIFLLDVLTAVGFFIIAIFLATYHKTHLNFSAKDALLIHSFSMFVLAIAILMGGRLSDQYGRKTIMGIGCAGIIVFAYPLFQCMQSCSMFWVLISHSVIAFFFGLFFGIIPSALSEMIPTKVRFSGLSIAHNLCMAIIGGGTPLVSTYLISHWHDPHVPAYLLIVAASVSFMTLFLFKDRSRQPLDE
jgi:MHS family proline/betaine transporter-like MFS transporter